MTTYTKPAANTASFTKPKRSDFIAGAKFDTAIFDKSKFDEPNDAYTAYTKPTANSTAYTKQAQS